MNILEKIPIIGVMGPGGSASETEINLAYELGKLITKAGWDVLTGGMNSGVMNAALKGAKEEDPKCRTIGILSSRGENASPYAERIIATGMGEGRNNLNVTSSTVIVSCCNNLGMSPGTMIEVVCAIKHKKPLILLYNEEQDNFSWQMYNKFLEQFSSEYRHEKQKILSDPKDVIAQISDWLK